MSKNNRSMHNARMNKDDEYYTFLNPIEEEISMHMDYVRQFEGKTVLCNCDDPEWSNFFLFFRLHFKQLKLKKVIFTHYEPDGKPSYKLEWSGDYLGYDTLNLIKTPLQGNGDFRSPECVALLDEADIVVTNPPFSLFREFIALLVKHKKDFVVIGNEAQITSKDIFPLMKEGKINVGYNHVKEFLQPDGNIKKFGTIIWYTTFKLDKYNEELMLGAQYEGHEDQYPKYDNYDAIEVNQIKRIPRDYWGVMGVYAATFFANWNKEQFEVIGCSGADCRPIKECIPETDTYGQGGLACYLTENKTHHRRINSRIFIRRLK